MGQIGIKPRGSIRIHRNGFELRAYAGVDPVTKRKDWLEERHSFASLGLTAAVVDVDELPPPVAKRLGVALTALVARADDLAAERKRRRRGEAAPGPAPEPDRTAGQSLEAWWKTHGRHLARAADARMVIDAFLKPRLEDVALWRLHPGLDPEAASRNPDLVDLTDMFDDLAQRGSVGGGGRRDTAGGPLGPDMLHKIRSVLSGALALEVAAGRLAANPCSGVSLPPIGARESTTPEPDELEAFLPYLAGAGRFSGGYTATRRTKTGTTVTYEVARRDLDPTIRDHQLLVFARLVASGPRPQEVSALQRGHYDKATGRLSLPGEGVVKKKDAGQPERWEVARGETDKRRKRTIRLDPVVAAELDRLLLEQDTFALECGRKLGRRAYLFSLAPDCSEPLSPNTAGDGFTDAVARAVAAGIDVPAGMRLYDMRHFGITQLLRAGRAPAAVAVRFATSERMIRSRYSHAIPGDDDHLAETMAGIWGPVAGPAEVVSLAERRDAGR